MNQGIRKIIVTMSLILCLFGTVFVTKVNAEDVSTENSTVTYERKVLPYTKDKVTEYLAGTNSYPTVEGYLFAGWYTDKKCDETCYLGVNKPSGTTYALFIPKQVLGVEAQIKAALTDGFVTDDDVKTSLRFVTSVDSLNYRKVGFFVTYEKDGKLVKDRELSSKKVYDKLYYVDSTAGTIEETPQSLFCNLSKYFKAGTVLNLQEGLYGMEFTVQPFWVTMEGDVVRGEEVVKSVDMGCIRDEVYVSSVEGVLDEPYYGTKEHPYASLDYAIAHVEDKGTVRVKDSLTVASRATWAAHKKTITITGDADVDADTIDFSANNELSIRDSVTFTNLNVAFSDYVYANGYSLKVAEDVNVTAAKYIYGGGKSVVKNTDLQLYAGTYECIYGGGHNKDVTGSTNVVIGANVNPNVVYTSHDHKNLLYGGCRIGNVGGNTNVTVEDGAKFHYIYGGGGFQDNNECKASKVSGKTNVTFAGKAYGVYGGSRYGTNANTCVKIIDGAEVYQVFGGCEHNSMIGNTDVQILGGNVYRRIYGGCYNEYSATNQATGTTSVTIGTMVDLNQDTDNALCAISRVGEAENETGVLIFQNGLYSQLSSKVQNAVLVGAHAYNYLVDATAGGKVQLTENGLTLTPDSGKKVLVRLDDSLTGEVAYYNDAEGTYSLPELNDSKREIFVEFSEDIESADINIVESENGTVTSSESSYYPASNTATLTVSPEEGYYCKSLTVTKDGESVELTPTVAFDQKTYTFTTEAGEYTVEANFVEKVFKVVTNNNYTSWNLINQYESTENLENGGRKITGTVVATDKYGSDKMDLISFNDTFTEMDLTYEAKDDPSTNEGSSPPGTQIEMKINGYTYKVRAVKNGDNIVLRVTGGMSKNTNMYTFTPQQAEDFAKTGVKVRVVKYGTSVTFYVDGTYAYTADLAELSTKVTADAEMSVYLGRFGDKELPVEIPFSVSDKVTPVAVEVYGDANKLVANESTAADVQNIDLTSNETYSVKLTPQGFDTAEYFKISYVDHVTKEPQSVYTSAVAAGDSFEFTYHNGVFDAKNETGIATSLWEHRYKATKDVLKVEVVSKVPEGATTIASGKEIGRKPMEKPAATRVQTNWTLGSAVSSAGEVTENAAYAYTDVITVEKKGTKLYFIDTVKTDSWATGDVFVVSSWKQDENSEWVFDAEGTNIAGQYTTGEITCTSGYETFIERYSGEKITYTYITTEDNENIRFCYYAGEETTSFPTVYSIYSGETGTAEEIALAADTTEWLETDKTRAYYDVFAGKTISVIGDSYMAGSDIKNTSNVWVNMFATKYGMTINNHGVNGSTISNYAGSKHNPMVDRWEADFANDTPNIIIVEGGRNDWNYNTPMGELGTTDKGTFKGAVTYLISSLKEKYPNAIVIGITCWEVGGNRNAAGYYCSDYGRAFIEVCESLDIKYINAMDSEDINVYMPVNNFKQRFCTKAGDVSHLNEKGMKLVLPIFEEKINGFCSTFEWKEEPQEEPQNIRIMSNNLWSCDKNTSAWSDKGYDCSAPTRAKGFLKVYAETMPDVIGMQECTELMQGELWNNLLDEGLAYTVIDGGRTPIFYNTDTLELVKSEHGVYPETYDGLTGSFNNENTKSWTLAVFNVKATGDKFIVLNTHLWYKSETAQTGSDQAREKQMEIAISKLQEYYEEYQCESYLVGDLNTTYSSSALQYAFTEEFKHAHDIAVEYKDDTVGTHTCNENGFGSIQSGEFDNSIDHILTYGERENSVRTFKRFSEEYYACLSDHLPVYIDVEF